MSSGPSAGVTFDPSKLLQARVSTIGVPVYLEYRDNSRQIYRWYGLWWSKVSSDSSVIQYMHPSQRSQTCKDTFCRYDHDLLLSPVLFQIRVASETRGSLHLASLQCVQAPGGIFATSISGASKPAASRQTGKENRKSEGFIASTFAFMSCHVWASNVRLCAVVNRTWMKLFPVLTCNSSQLFNHYTRIPARSFVERAVKVMHYPTFLKERQQSLTAFLHAALVLDPTVEGGVFICFHDFKDSPPRIQMDDFRF